jgi:hypothetical protein
LLFDSSDPHLLFVGIGMSAIHPAEGLLQAANIGNSPSFVLFPMEPFFADCSSSTGSEGQFDGIRQAIFHFFRTKVFLDLFPASN